MSEVFLILSKLNESKLFSIISPPIYPDDSITKIGRNDKMKKTNANLEGEIIDVVGNGEGNQNLSWAQDPLRDSR